MPWKPGQSGNPSGRPRSKKQSRTITELAREYAPSALRTLKKLMDDPKSSSTARAIACDRILDRAYGKPPAAIGVIVGGQARKPEEYSDAELAAIIARGAEQCDVHDTRLIEGAAVEKEIEEDVMAELSSASDGNK